LQSTYDEFISQELTPREDVSRVVGLLDGLGAHEFRRRQKLANTDFFKRGVTFAVYADSRGAEKIFPFDVIPRIVPRVEPEALRDYVKERLRSSRAPQHIVFRDELPYNETGKLLRRVVRADLAEVAK
jgi:uncharacterized circularly permuted ATP-grasp superfamily protein